MTGQPFARTISSFAAPTHNDLLYFESLPDSERYALLRTEIDEGIASGLSARTFDEIVAGVKAKCLARRTS